MRRDALTKKSHGCWSDAHIFSAGNTHRILYSRILGNRIAGTRGITNTKRMTEQWHAHQGLDSPSLVGAFVYSSPWVMLSVIANAKKAL